MRRAGMPVALLLALSAAAAAQDVVRLKGGRMIAGTLEIDEADKEGFKLQRWDTGGAVYIKWASLPDAEKNRLLGRAPADAAAGPAVELIDGIQVLTELRTELGLLVKEDATQLFIKTNRSKTAVPIPKTALLKPYDKVKIRESDAFSSDEMIERRVAKADEKNYAQMLEVGRFAAGLKLYERAKEFYQKAAAADASKKDEIEAVLAQNETLIKEGKASALLDQVKEKVENTEYPAAIELAKRLLSEFGDTELGRQNKELVAQLEREAKDWEVKKAEVLAQKVPEMYKAKRGSLFSQYSGSKTTLAQARSAIPKIDEEVVKDLAAKFKSTPDEIVGAWGKREKKIRTASYGDGSWIVKGGQDGGLDTEQQLTPKPPQQQNNNMGGFGNQFGGNQNRNTQRNQQQMKPIPLGKPLQKAEEWWQSASSADRKLWIEAEYAKQSSQVEKEVKTKKCTTCAGEGMLKSTRSGVSCDVKCSRCHGAKEDEIVTYK